MRIDREEMTLWVDLEPYLEAEPTRNIVDRIVEKDLTRTGGVLFVRYLGDTVPIFSWKVRESDVSDENIFEVVCTPDCRPGLQGWVEHVGYEYGRLATGYLDWQMFEQISKGIRVHADR